MLSTQLNYNKLKWLLIYLFFWLPLFYIAHVKSHVICLKWKEWMYKKGKRVRLKPQKTCTHTKLYSWITLMSIFKKEDFSIIYSIPSLVFRFVLYLFTFVALKIGISMWWCNALWPYCHVCEMMKLRSGEDLSDERMKICRNKFKKSWKILNIWGKLDYLNVLKFRILTKYTEVL